VVEMPTASQRMEHQWAVGSGQWVHAADARWYCPRHAFIAFLPWVGQPFGMGAHPCPHYALYSVPGSQGNPAKGLS
jgi:hypothetical protein